MQLTNQQQPEQPSTSGSSSSLQHHHHHQPQQLQGKVARFAAQKHAAKPVQEVQRALAEYMALPASQYSVLDARKIERLDDTTFRLVGWLVGWLHGSICVWWVVLSGEGAIGSRRSSAVELSSLTHY